MNRLYYGDNLDILRNHEYFPPECVDLIYLDPPFNSKRDYNALFKDESGKYSDAQITAFEDTWHWGESAAGTYRQLVTDAPVKVSQVIGALHTVIGENEMMAYLVMMAARLVELHRVLKPTGSLYLHCDPTASHYLKLVTDAIFGAENFRNEIIWQRTAAKGLATRRLPTNHDVILFYQKTSAATWNANAIFTAYDENDLDEKTSSKYSHRDPDGRLYRLDNLINPNSNRPNLTYEFLGVTKVWRWTKERMQKAYQDGIVIQTKPGTVPQMKRYLDEQRGKPSGDVWIDIPPVNSQAKERTGYPTQKPLALLERIIQASSNPGDIVLDPFAGCGTAITAAQKLGRQWIGIDITHLSITVQKLQLEQQLGIKPGIDYKVIGEPRDVSGARELAQQNRHQFEWWALSLVRARPSGGGEAPTKGARAKGKKGGDRGIDGEINFVDDNNKSMRILVSVKSNAVVLPEMIRDLRGTVEREGAAMGVLITLSEPTAGMRKEALSAGVYHSPLWKQDYPKLQIITIEALLDQQKITMPPQHGTFKTQGRLKDELPKTVDMFDT